MVFSADHVSPGPSIPASRPLSGSLSAPAVRIGFGGNLPWLRRDTGPLLESVKVSELRPGHYCEIYMVVPPTASEDSFQCYKGTVKEINHDEVVLTDVLEESCIEYGTGAQRSPPVQQKHEEVHVPLMGVDTILALPPSKDDAGPGRSTKPPAVPPASSGANASSPPAAAHGI